MDRSAERRALLSYAAASSLLLGFPLLSRAAENGRDLLINPQVLDAVPARREAAGDHERLPPPAPLPPRKPATPDQLMSRALERMKRERKPGVVLVVPKEPERAAALSDSLTALVLSRRAEAHQVLCEAVYVCLPAADVAKRFPRREPGWTAILLDETGRQIAGDVLAFDDTFAAQFSELLHGPHGRLLRERAAAHRKAMGPERCATFDRLVTALSHDNPKTREWATDQLGSFSPTASAALAEAARTTDSAEARLRLKGVFTRQYLAAAYDQPGPRAVLGAEWTQEVRQVRVEREPAPCMECGMARAPARSRSFIRLSVAADEAEPGKTATRGDEATDGGTGRRGR
jgi:hypothetical protein